MHKQGLTSVIIPLSRNGDKQKSVAKQSHRLGEKMTELTPFWTWICKRNCWQHEHKRGYSPMVADFLLLSVPTMIWLDNHHQKGRCHFPILLSCLHCILCPPGYTVRQLSSVSQVVAFLLFNSCGFLWNGQDSTRVV